VKYFITSGNSQVGAATIKYLKAAGETDIVAGTRNVKKSEEELKKAGATSVVEIDLGNLESITNALKGAERVLLVHGPGDYVGFAKNVASAAKTIDSIKVVIRIAGSQSDAESKDPIMRIHGQAFNALKESGKTTIAVGPNFFLENWFGQIPSIKGGAVYGSAGDSRIGYIAVDDIGAVAAAVLRNPEPHAGKHIPITGSEAVTESEVLHHITEAAGIQAKYVSLSDEDFKASLLKHGIDEPTAAFIIVLENLKRSGYDDVTHHVQDIIGRPPITAQQWAKDHAARFK